MPSTDRREPRRRIWPTALLWLGLGAVLVAISAWRLHDRVHPWELSLTISQ